MTEEDFWRATKRLASQRRNPDTFAEKFVKYATERQRVQVEGNLEYMMRRHEEVGFDYSLGWA